MILSIGHYWKLKTPSSFWEFLPKQWKLYKSWSLKLGEVVMGELSRNRPLQPRKLTNENVVRLKMSLARVKPCYPSNTVSLQCFHAQGTTKDHWKPFPFSCLVAETLIALFASGNTSPAEAEKRMQDWCARPVRVSNIHYLVYIIYSSDQENYIMGERGKCPV